MNVTKMILFRHYYWILTLVLCYPNPCDAQAHFWSEFWQQYGFRKTNFADIQPQEYTNFSILTSTYRPGYRVYFTKDAANQKWRTALDAYLRFENVHDFLRHREGHSNVFNNNVRYGGGLKFRVEQDGGDQAQWLRWFQMDVFAEWQRMDTFVDDVRSWFEDISQSNFRTGINAWSNSGDKHRIRQETYFDLSWHTTNWSDNGDGPYFIFTLSPRVYFRLGRVLDVYVNAEVVKDLLDQGRFNHNPYSNNFKTYLGARTIFSVKDLLKINEDHILGHASILLYADYAMVNYFDKREDFSFADPLTTPDLDIAKDDFRIGFILWWPLGVAKYRPIGQSPLG